MIKAQLSMGVELLGSLIDAQISKTDQLKQLVIRNIVNEDGANSSITLSQVGQQLKNDVEKLGRVIGLNDVQLPDINIPFPDELKNDLNKLKLELKVAYLHIKKEGTGEIDVKYAFRVRILGGDQINFGIKIHYLDLSIWNTENEKIISEIGIKKNSDDK